MKKIIFSFFHFREVLGLDLKILFHKNKEIKRMLSKKMTFSLMSLITLLALAFVTLPASAADPFDVTFEGRTAVTYTVSTAEDIQNRPQDTSVIVTIKTGLPVAAMKQSVTAFDKNNLPITGVGNADANGVTAGAVILELSSASGDIDNKNYDADYVPTSTMRKYWIGIDPQGGEATDLIVAKVVVSVPELTTNDPTAVDDKGALVTTKLKSYTRVITVTAVPTDTSDLPKVVSIQRLRPGSQTVVAAFQEERIEPEPFNVRVVLSALPHGIDLADVNNFIEVENGTVSNLVTGVTFAQIGQIDENNAPVALGTLRPHPIEGMYAHNGDVTGGYAPLQGVPEGFDGVTVPGPTSDDAMYRQYRVTITPHIKSANFDIKVKVKSFHDNGAVIRYTYLPPGFGDSAFLPNGRDILTIPVKGTARDLEAGYRVTIPKDWIIPGWWLLDRRSEYGWLRNRRVRSNS